MFVYKIQTDEGEKEQKGVKVGDYFAVTPVYAYGSLASGYCVTHLPTGMAIAGFFIPGYAIRCCKSISSNWDWNFTPDKILFSFETRQEIVETIKRFQEEDYQAACEHFGWDEEEAEDYYLG